MRFLAVFLGLVTAAATTWLIIVVRSGGPPGQQAVPKTTQAPRAPSAGPDWRTQAGVVANSLYDFQKDTAAYPSLTVDYLRWGQPFPVGRIVLNHRLGAKTLVILEPALVSLKGIADGRLDQYLKAFGRADHRLGLPIMLSFAPEANGKWYTWGAHHIGPKLYVAMWHRVHDVIMADGGSKITWIWQMNVPWPGSEPIHLLWPGKRYVNQVGIDGQLRTRGATFAKVFGGTLRDVRRFSRAPIMISEVSVAASPTAPHQITGLFTAACRIGLTAVIMFDIHPRWRFDDSAPSLTAYRQAATAGCPAQAVAHLSRTARRHGHAHRGHTPLGRAGLSQAPTRPLRGSPRSTDQRTRT